MKVAFPSQENAGMGSPVYGHFGSARFFIIVDSATGQIDAASNNDLATGNGGNIQWKMDLLWSSLIL